jgi:HlyD family secretion protein
VRIVLGVLVALILVFAAVVVVVGPDVSKWGPASSGSASGTKVRLHTVAQGRLVETVSAPGEIIPNTKVDISAEVSARILELPFREGERVAKGDVVVRLDDKQFRAELESTKARRNGERFRLQSEQSRIAGPEASLANAKVILERQQTLFDSGDIARQTLDDAIERVRELESTVASAKHNISVIESSLAGAEADIDRVQEALDKTVIAAPMAGNITVLNAEVGELVVVGTMNNAGTVIMSIGDLSTVKLNAKVNEADIARVARDQVAKLRINAYKGEVFDGVVVKVPLQRTTETSGANAGTGYFKVEIEVKPKEGRQILSGLAGNVDIEIAAHQGLVLPSQSILDKPSEDLPEDITKDSPLVDRGRRTTPVVFRVVDGKAALTPVRAGPSSLTDTMIVAGLAEGDVVITGPYKVLEKLKHGEAVQPETVAEPSAAPTVAEAKRPAG